MNPEIKAKWVEALRSGKYKQGTGKLRRLTRTLMGLPDVSTDQFCCLGVLCELAIEAGVIDQPNRAFGSYRYGTDHDADLLPREVGLWAGIDQRDPRVVTGHDLIEGPTCYSLSVVNDSGESFETIAGYIEKSL